MTNYEKYPTKTDKIIEFRKFCNYQILAKGCANCPCKGSECNLECFLAWLEIEDGVGEEEDQYYSVEVWSSIRKWMTIYITKDFSRANKEYDAGAMVFRDIRIRLHIGNVTTTIKKRGE